MKKHYDFPSSRLNDIFEPYARRKPRAKKAPVLDIILGMLLLTALYFAVAQIVDNQARQSQIIREVEAAEITPLCRQYLHDTKLAGTAAQETLQAICTNN